MVFVLVEGGGTGRMMLVKAESRHDVEKVFQLDESLYIVGSFTDDEIDLLRNSKFCVVGK